MRLRITDYSYVVFDLDDTLYPEVDFVHSGFRHISQLVEPVIGCSVAAELMDRYRQGRECFHWLAQTYELSPDLSGERLLDQYRNHVPELVLPDGTRALLDALTAYNVPFGLLTDGRSVSQRNKIKALGFEHRFVDIIISDEFGSAKPDLRNYRVFEERHPQCEFTIVADNTAKDFQVPSQRGWQTICLRSSPDNVHAQDLDAEPRPQHVVDSLAQITVIRG